MSCTRIHARIFNLNTAAGITGKVASQVEEGLPGGGLQNLRGLLVPGEVATSSDSLGSGSQCTEDILLLSAEGVGWLFRVSTNVPQKQFILDI